MKKEAGNGRISKATRKNGNCSQMKERRKGERREHTVCDSEGAARSTGTLS